MSINSIIKNQRFIPFSLHDIKELCRNLGAVESKQFDRHSDLVEQLIHLRFYKHLNVLKLAYTPSNPDCDTKTLSKFTVADELQSSEILLNTLQYVLNAANYEVISQQYIKEAMAQQSMFKIRLDIDFDEFEELLVFGRGKGLKTETVKGIIRYFDKDISFVNYERILIFVRFKNQTWFDKNKRKVPYNATPGALMLKLFKNVPQADLEILFPNTKIKMRSLDKLLIGGPAIASGVMVLMTKLGATLLLLGSLISFWFGWSEKEVTLDQKNFVVLGAGLATLGGYLWKQFSAFKNRQIKFMKLLSDSLYFKNLDNNAGVFHYLIDNAQESECKEVLLAWTFLHLRKRATAQQLDHYIERYFEEKLESHIDFEIKDALDKLINMKLAIYDGNEYIIVPVEQSLNALLIQWNKGQ